jgi:hypothetical protein
MLADARTAPSPSEEQFALHLDQARRLLSGEPPAAIDLSGQEVPPTPVDDSVPAFSIP